MRSWSATTRRPSLHYSGSSSKHPIRPIGPISCASVLGQPTTSAPRCAPSRLRGSLLRPSAVGFPRPFSSTSTTRWARKTNRPLPWNLWIGFTRIAKARPSNRASRRLFVICSARYGLATSSPRSIYASTCARKRCAGSIGIVPPVNAFRFTARII